MRIPREAFEDPEVRLRKLLEKLGAHVVDREIVLTTLMAQYEGQEPSGYVLELRGSPAKAAVIIYETGCDHPTIVCIINTKTVVIRSYWQRLTVMEYLHKRVGDFGQFCGLHNAWRNAGDVISHRKSVLSIRKLYTELDPPLRRKLKP